MSVVYPLRFGFLKSLELFTPHSEIGFPGKRFSVTIAFWAIEYKQTVRLNTNKEQILFIAEKEGLRVVGIVRA